MRISSLRSLVGPVQGAQLVLATISSAVLLLGLAVPRLGAAAYPPSAEGGSMAVTTDSADATHAALEVMAAGGNAADGAIAAALALGVVNPIASGIGGGGFALVYSAKDQKVSAIDFREVAPAKYDGKALYPAQKPGDPPRDRWKWNGPRGIAVGVPGEPAGLELLSQRYAKRTLSDDAAPAVRLAQGGFFLPKHTADLLPMFQNRIQAVPSLATALLPNGSPARYGARVRRPDLAATLARFGAEGKKAIYEGDTAQKIVDAVRGAGGTMSREDLAGYQVKERAPLSRIVDGRAIYAMPAPSAGGLMLLETLQMYGASKSSALSSMGFGSGAYLHTIAEAMRGAFSDRVRVAGDPDLDPAVLKGYEGLLDPAQLEARRAKIDPNKTHAATEFKTNEKGTSHLVVADAEGNVVTLTTTVNGPFGASIVAGDSGVLLNNELDDFSSPEDVKPFGVAGGGPNQPRPRARPVSSMTPVIVLENGAPILALGGSGGTRIATAATQAALARLVFDLDPAACVSHPRIHVQGPDLLADREIAPDVKENLKGRGETVKDEPFQGSAIQMIAWQKGRVLAAADPRKAGFAVAR